MKKKINLSPKCLTVSRKLLLQGHDELKLTTSFVRTWLKVVDRWRSGYVYSDAFVVFAKNREGRTKVSYKRCFDGASEDGVGVVI